MKIQVNTDSSVKGDQRLEEFVQDAIEQKLNRFRQHLSRVEVHIRDENSLKGGPDDKRCMIEARIKGLDPSAVDHKASTVEAAINGSVAKMQQALDRKIGKRKEHR